MSASDIVSSIAGPSRGFGALPPNKWTLDVMETTTRYSATWILVIGFGLIASSSTLADEAEVANAFAKAAAYVANPDFIHSPVTIWFTEAELSILGEHRTALNSLVKAALVRDSVGGAALTAHFRLENNIPYLRWLLFQPGTTYGWEGPNYDSEEDFLTDNQYVFHSVYADAIEQTAGAPLHEVVLPNSEELETLYRLQQDPYGKHYYWARWRAPSCSAAHPGR
jgi:hypothetical protein